MVARNENLFRYLNISIIYIENGISKRGLFFLLQPLNKNKRVEQNVFDFISIRNCYHKYLAGGPKALLGDDRVKISTLVDVTAEILIYALNEFYL